MKSVLILGAGLSGLGAARVLQADGCAVVVVDKGRGVGGRMATRRFEGGTFDHGAQFFTARSGEFRELVAEWIEKGVAEEWFRGYPSPTEEKPEDGYPRYCGSAGMTGILKYLAQGVDVRLNEEIRELRFEDGEWVTVSESGASFSGEELVLTAPVPQSLELLGEIELPHEAREILEGLRYEPCFAVLANMKGASRIPSPGALYINGEVLSWVADNFQKGISGREGSVTVHSSGDWAKAHYEDDQDEVGRLLLNAAAPYIGDEVESFQVRRWRYSKPENPVEVGSLRVPELQLTFAGDIFQGAKVEGAVLSGLHAAHSILQK